ncbi:hypothetical protein EYF80_064330 [Liparis tanakae]|uniref:Uncharacterized protein n=1 Tax=Liparis tanakae TaxID=230148 RepID=A0A4Z2EAG2_9TELE|nr:hypothetical protein EYF80_064330 [Liparis tanakae]
MRPESVSLCTCWTCRTHLILVQHLLLQLLGQLALLSLASSASHLSFSTSVRRTPGTLGVGACFSLMMLSSACTSAFAFSLSNCSSAGTLSPEEGGSAVSTGRRARGRITLMSREASGPPSAHRSSSG